MAPGMAYESHQSNIRFGGGVLFETVSKKTILLLSAVSFCFSLPLFPWFV